MSLHHLHVPQANMLVVDSKPLTNLTLQQNNLIKDNNKVGQNHIKWNWQVTLCGLVEENSNNLYAYLACGV